MSHLILDSQTSLSSMDPALADNPSRYKIDDLTHPSQWILSASPRGNMAFAERTLSLSRFHIPAACASLADARSAFHCARVYRLTSQYPSINSKSTKLASDVTAVLRNSVQYRALGWRPRITVVVCCYKNGNHDRHNINI